MTIRNALWFFRPTFLAVFCFGIAMWIATFAFPRRDLERKRDLESVERVTSAMNLIRSPSPTIEPEEVVRIQVDALAEADRANGVLQCFTFASPGNRIATGPIGHFGEMIRSPPYNVLIDRDAVLIGTPQLDKGVARILVTVLEKREPKSFVWVLSRQTTGQFAECWMTDGVFFLNSRQQSQPKPDMNGLGAEEI